MVVDCDLNSWILLLIIHFKPNTSRPILHLWKLSSFLAKAQKEQSIVKPGSLLKPITNSSWLSSSGPYAFGFYKQGNGYAVGVFLAGVPQKTVVWTANWDNHPVLADVKLSFTSDGRLVLQSSQGTETSIADFPQGEMSAYMLDSGNFVVHSSDDKQYGKVLKTQLIPS